MEKASSYLLIFVMLLVVLSCTEYNNNSAKGKIYINDADRIVLYDCAKYSITTVFESDKGSVKSFV